MSSAIVRYLNPWRFKREQQELQRMSELRRRDGDECRRCRRPMRFDLSDGHDLGPRVEQVMTSADSEAPGLDNLCLVHRRCNTEPADFTAEVKERIRRKNEAELFARSRKRA
jgi:hypothetical protein